MEAHQDAEWKFVRHNGHFPLTLYKRMLSERMSSEIRASPQAMACDSIVLA